MLSEEVRPHINTLQWRWDRVYEERRKRLAAEHSAVERVEAKLARQKAEEAERQAENVG
jgi:hypothetical protein